MLFVPASYCQFDPLLILCPVDAASLNPVQLKIRLRVPIATYSKALRLRTLVINQNVCTCDEQFRFVTDKDGACLKTDFEQMSLDELWNLREEITLILEKKINGEKKAGGASRSSGPKPLH